MSEQRKLLGRRSIAMLLFIVLLFFSFRINSYAEDSITAENLIIQEQESQSEVLSDSIGTYSEISLFNTYISTCSASLGITGSTASSVGTCTGYISNTSSVSIYLYLQKKSGTSWSTYASTSSTFSSYSGVLTFATKNITSGTYRVKASCWANGENVIVYSVEKTY